MPQDLSVYINNLVIEKSFSNNSNQINSILFEILEPNITLIKIYLKMLMMRPVSKVSM